MRRKTGLKGFTEGSLPGAGPTEAAKAKGGAKDSPAWDPGWGRVEMRFCNQGWCSCSLSAGEHRRTPKTLWLKVSAWKYLQRRGIRSGSPSPVVSSSGTRQPNIDEMEAGSTSLD